MDRYHFIRQMVWAFDKVRKRIQQIYGKKYRLLFKHSKRLLIKRNVKLKDWKKERSNSLLYISDEMLQAYYLKEQFYKIMDANDRQTAKQLMSDWISSAESCNIEEYKYCAKTLLNWQTEILNSFDVRLFKQFYQRL
ncbi:transposase [Hominilimicola fabiformis]|uniref:transposase n=1 Tax=Hominilimicola fabiformis TaxID=2885356 RepID=UPI00358DD41D